MNKLCYFADSKLYSEISIWIIRLELRRENFCIAFQLFRISLLGEMGEPVIVDKTLPEVKKAMREYGFNTYVSDMISLNRSVPDVRMDE